jgi:hypothetical protein
MTLEEFAELVEKMRDLQKKYFRDRDADTLLAAKAKEAEVDRVIKRITGGQQVLF